MYTVRQNPANENNYTPTDGRNINRVIIHHAATTSFDGIGATFANPARGASAHYGVGQNNNVDQYVDEKDISWAAGNWYSNENGINIECVNSTMGPEWLVAETTFNTLVELTRDIMSRNGLLPAQVGVNLFGHQDVSDVPTFCPGVLEPRLQELADAINNGQVVPQPTQPDQVLDIGSRFIFSKQYRVDDLQPIGGIWQVMTRELCPIGFAWDDNGIPVEPLVEVSDPDQVLSVGSIYTIPGEYTVLNLGVSDGVWLAEIDMGGWKLWVDIATVTEI